MKNGSVYGSQAVLLVLGAAILIFLVKKAALMQVTCDEAYTLQILVKESWYDIVMYTSSYTNNHILHTLAAKALHQAFGMHPLIGRLPNIVAFMLYFYFAYRLALLLTRQAWEQTAFVALCVGNPYLLDFFACARGYGVSIAFIMMSLYFFVKFARQRDAASLWKGELAAVAAVYAQFATLHYFLGINLVLGLLILTTGIAAKDLLWTARRLGIQLLNATLLGALIYFPIKSILRDNQIAYYGSNGFWQDTISSLIKNSLYAQGYFADNTTYVFLWLTAALIALTLLAAIVFYKDKKMTVLTGAFMATAFSAIAQFHLLGNQYPTDRIALFFYPLLAIQFYALFRLLEKAHYYIYIGVVLVSLAFGINHLIRSCNLTQYREWWYDMHTYDALATMQQDWTAQQRNRPATVRCSPWLYPAVGYHVEQQQLSLFEPPLYVKNIDTNTTFDYYYIFSSDYAPIAAHYEKIKDWLGGGILLVKRKNMPAQ